MNDHSTNSTEEQTSSPSPFNTIKMLDVNIIKQLFTIFNHLLYQSQTTNPKITQDLAKHINKTVKITIEPLHLSVMWRIVQNIDNLEFPEHIIPIEIVPMFEYIKHEFLTANNQKKTAELSESESENSEKENNSSVFDLTITLKDFSLNNLEIQGNIGLAQALQQLKGLKWDLEDDLIRLLGPKQGLWLAQKLTQSSDFMQLKITEFVRKNPYFIHQNDLITFKQQLRDLRILLDRTEQRVKWLEK
jgi:ubiquinone biosynthesis protein UbiJ